MWELIEAGIFLSEELNLDAVLRRIVETSCRVIGARYGALGVLSDDRTGLSNFIFHGMTEADRERIGDLPVGRGLLGAVIAEQEPIRLADLTGDPRSIGFPNHHPPMKSFLGVPVRAKGQVFGNLYLTEKQGAVEFSGEDERLVIVLAGQAGVAIENARLYGSASELAEAKVRAELRDQTIKASIRAQEEERRRIARELHDSAGQALASILLGLKVASDEKTLQDVRSRLADLREIAAEAAGEVRRISRELRPSVLDDLGLEPALERLSTDIEDRSDITVSRSFDLADRRLDPEVEIVVYRVAQEALTNSVKYAGATEIALSLRQDDDVIRLVVVDNGCGFDPAANIGLGLGLGGMQERAELVGGQIELRSAPEQGTAVALEIPITKAGARD